MIIEQALYEFLKEKTDIPVFCEIPADDVPEEFFLIEKTGSSMSNHINMSQITIQTYADRMFRASVLNDFMKHMLIYEAIKLNEMISISLNADYNYTDTQEKKYRYQAVFDIKHY